MERRIWRMNEYCQKKRGGSVWTIRLRWRHGSNCGDNGSTRCVDNHWLQSNNRAFVKRSAVVVVAGGSRASVQLWPEFFRNQPLVCSFRQPPKQKQKKMRVPFFNRATTRARSPVCRPAADCIVYTLDRKRVGWTGLDWTGLDWWQYNHSRRFLTGPWWINGCLRFPPGKQSIGSSLFQPKKEKTFGRRAVGGKLRANRLFFFLRDNTAQHWTLNAQRWH